jgi:hypothetical protein
MALETIEKRVAFGDNKAADRLTTASNNAAASSSSTQGWMMSSWPKEPKKTAGKARRAALKSPQWSTLSSRRHGR